MERLQKVIATSGYCSRRKAEELITNGKVSINGNIITTLGTKVKNSDEILVEGTVIDNKKSYEYYLLNKPREVISAVSDNKHRKTVTDIVKTNARIYPIGRLDYDTTGLILLTNDGNLANMLMHPSYNIDKTCGRLMHTNRKLVEILEFSSKIDSHKCLTINDNNVKFYLDSVKVIVAVCV